MEMYETLLTKEECAHAIDMGHFFRVPCDKRDLNYDKYFNDGNRQGTMLSAFTSDNTRRLDVEEVKSRLLELPYIREEMIDWGH